MYCNKSHKNYLQKVPLIRVYQHTLKYCENDRFPRIPSTKYNYLDVEFSDDKFLEKYVSLAVPPKIMVENIDSFEMAIKIYGSTNNDINPLVLNLASDYKPGGGVGSGAKAQEEDLFRKSNYACVLDKGMYPLKTEEVVYSPSVFIIKDNVYDLLKVPVEVSCLAVAALRNPKITTSNGQEKYFRQIDAEVMQNKIDMIFKVALRHGNLDLVLGALGCGAFHNPPDDVANMFRKSIEKYGKYFRTIGFAILSKKDNPNYEIFNKIINGK